MSEGKRTKSVLIRLTEEEDRLLKEDAKAQGRELAQHIRWLALEGRKLVEARTERHARAAAMTDIDLAKMRDLIRAELERLRLDGGLYVSEPPGESRSRK